ncbi:hypothetical protein DPMN_082466 [Dreissena polymorpha]|uniref:Uncharacterized protein n=1 Tax=Dreissena polymorpha TaxID=45954 RepID=A0A9D4BIV5_DREPO|nr:hypothetical protein DPMN_082466 [Dreissena polymorpha]
MAAARLCGYLGREARRHTESSGCSLVVLQLQGLPFHIHHDLSRRRLRISFLILNLYRTTTNQWRSTNLRMKRLTNLSLRMKCHVPRESSTTDCPGGAGLWKTRSGFSLITFKVYTKHCCSHQRQRRPLC